MKALKWLWLIPMVSLLGCASPSGWTVPTQSPASDPPKTSETTASTMTPPEYANWLSPSKVTISNFHDGAVAEYPIKFHNAKVSTTDQKVVTTGDNDTIGDIPLNSAGLYKNDITSVSVVSDNPQDRLQVMSYNPTTNSIIIVGFVSNAKRIISITYKPMTAYSVHFRLPDNVMPKESARMAQDWVIVADPTLVMSPLETREDVVTVSIPSGVKVPDQNWEFWIGVSEITKGGGGAAVSLELVSRWIVNMKPS